MKKHIRIYLQYFDYGIDDRISCEICGNKAVDVHHIDNKGMGGSRTKDFIENLIALCRGCHIKAHSERISKGTLSSIHLETIKTIV
jgi:5-methylcytosine-specific restriction endonuclease McrA